MRILLGLFIATFLCFSCQETTKKSSAADLEKIADLQGQLAQLKVDSELKESLIKESLSFFDEIHRNLETIQLKKEEIKLRSGDPELTEDEKQWIIQEIKHINYLRIENGRKVNTLNNELKKSGFKIKELETMVEGLLQEMEDKDIEIAILQDELKTVDKEYSRLFDAYTEQEIIVNELTEQINTAYYSYGTLKELVENQVVEKKNGFIGVGKKTKLAENFNQEYFTKVDVSKTKNILIEGSEIRFITDHPSASYQLVAVGKNTRIIIKSPKDFWKVTKYMVIMVNK
jgi:chromosome segregation ATPase